MQRQKAGWGSQPFLPLSPAPDTRSDLTTWPSSSGFMVVVSPPYPISTGHWGAFVHPAECVLWVCLFSLPPPPGGPLPLLRNASLIYFPVHDSWQLYSESKESCNPELSRLGEGLGSLLNQEEGQFLRARHSKNYQLAAWPIKAVQPGLWWMSDFFFFKVELYPHGHPRKLDAKYTFK